MFGSQAQDCISILLFSCLLCTLFVNIKTEEIPENEILNVSLFEKATVGENITLKCVTKIQISRMWWTCNNENVTDSDRHAQEVHLARETVSESATLLHITNLTFADHGNCSCHASFDDEPNQEISEMIDIDLSIPGSVISNSAVSKLSSNNQTTLFCLVKGFPIEIRFWLKGNDLSNIASFEQYSSNVTAINQTHINMTMTFNDLTRKDNGTYFCVARDSNSTFNASVSLIVLDKPQVSIDFVKAVGANKFFMNWTINDGNDPIDKYFVQYLEEGTAMFTYYNEHIAGGNKSYVLQNFKPDTNYKFQLYASNSQGQGVYKDTKWYKTLKKDPIFIPKIKVKGNSLNTITIGWALPDPFLMEHVHYYELIAQEYNTNITTEVVLAASSKDLPYMFSKLKVATLYKFKTRACSDYTSICGNWSEFVNGTTGDGIAGPPENVSISCRLDNVSQTSWLVMKWMPPLEPNGKIIHYNVVLKGKATFKSERGITSTETFGPKIKTIDQNTNIARFERIPANTNYTIHVSGVTKIKKPGEEVTKTCTMPPTVPEHIGRFTWSKIEEHGKYMFKLDLPRISERNGAICCYKVFIIRMLEHQTLSDLPQPENLLVSTHQEVHSSANGGVYVAEMFTSEELHSEVFLGDGVNVNRTISACSKCIGLRPRSAVNKPPIITTEKEAYIPSLLSTPGPPETSTSNSIGSSKSGLNLLLRRKRNIQVISETNESLKDNGLVAFDGYLNSSSNYSGFVEIIVYGAVKGQFLPGYSDYFIVMSPGKSSENQASVSDFLGVTVQVLCALILIVLVLLIALCLLHRYTKQVAQAQGVEMITLRNSFSFVSRHLCRSLRGRHQLVSSSPPDMSPIPKGELLDAYIERHRDSDYGFQQEFELLPDRFLDRTTRASEQRENLYKNRYPDIKAYDQTRVHLAQIDSIAGSDYINANFVHGYKERKKFICAQGPMDNTIIDYWRMIWEQHTDLILMLTNLEEYNKTKCAKYWPDKVDGDKNFGDIKVTHMQEIRYSDFAVRDLKVSRCVTGKLEDRTVTQYHFLVWKDFLAPEHPHGILKFIRRINEAYSFEKGPILVHCSAGVGRTGTLVALDSLLQQLNEEGQVAIFNTICDLRHQRNFLVQSLKQYIFIYRTLMEVAQYGDTEIHANKLKVIMEKLRTREPEKDKSKMEEDFEKIKSVIEDRKSFSVGGGEENRGKNRCDLIIPYDRNRVILTPLIGREHSTYINASFIEGYDNSESFIITQDPLENTIPDFWRMISEQGISTLVMLADLGDGPKKCPRYWPDDDVLHDHIQVKYIQSESCPYYTRRELVVTNTKTDESTVVTQLHYQGWPTVEGEVPEVTRGLIELIDQAQTNQAQGALGPIAVHCNCGSDRSSMFVALSILVQQLRTEKRVDIFTTTRKLRSQRHSMIDTFAQYEFLHRAIVNYADLHHLSES